MATVIIAKNQTAGDLTLTRLGAPDAKIPASGQVTLTDYNFVWEIQEDTEVEGYITSDDLLLNVDAVDLDKTESLNLMAVSAGFEHAQIVSGNPHVVTKTEVSLGNVTDDAQLKRSASDFGTFGEVTTVAPDDIFLVEDTSDSNNKKKVQLTNLATGVIGVVLIDMSAGTRQEYASITAALAASSAGDTVLTGPGTYAESFTVPAGVTLRGQGGSRVTKITGALATGTRVTMSNGAVLHGFTITLPTDATYGILYAGAAPSLAISRDIVFIGSGALGKCYGQTGTGSSEILDSFVQQGSMACVYEVTNGELLVREALISKYVTLITDVCCANGGTLGIEAMIARGAGIVDGISVGAGEVIGTVIEFQSLSGSAIHMTNNSGDCQIRSIRCDACNKDVEVDAAITTAKLHIISGELLESKIDVPDAWHASADHFIMYQDEKLGDAALKIWGELHVGSQQHGTTSAFGEGSSYTSGMYCFRNTNLEAGTWSDISATYTSSSGSTASIFAGTGVGQSFYIGSATPFSGHYAYITTAGVLGTGNLISEYWNGTSWVTTALMAVDAESPHDQYGADISELAGKLNLRFGPQPSWASKSLDGTTAYWVRYRITAAWTTAPVCEQMKIAINSVEIGPNGFMEFFGEARPQRNLPWHLSLLDDANGQDPGNERVRFSTNVDVALLDNEYIDGVLDGRAGIIEIPFGIDTSYPLEIRWVWAQNAAGSGDVDFDLYYSKASVGDQFNNILSQTNLSNIYTLSTGLADESYEITFTIPIYDMVPGDLLGIALSRDATAGNVDDTYAGGIYLIATSASGYFWR